MDISNNYFHGISFTCWDKVDKLSDLDLLRTILIDKKLMTRESLFKDHPEYYKNLSNYGCNGDNRVSICCHPERHNDYIDKLLNERFFGPRDSSGFESFVYNNISIILDNKILDDYDYLLKGMLGEFQVFGDVSLDYMVAFGVPNYFERIIKEVNKVLEKDESDCNFKSNFWIKRLMLADNVNDFLNNCYNENGYLKYEQIKANLKEFGYDIPVVDPLTGLEWSSREEIKKQVDNLRYKAKQRKLIKF